MQEDTHIPTSGGGIALLAPNLGALFVMAVTVVTAAAEPNCIVTKQRVECSDGVGGMITERGDVWLDDGRIVRKEDLGIVKRRDEDVQPQRRDQRPLNDGSRTLR